MIETGGSNGWLRGGLDLDIARCDELDALPLVALPLLRVAGNFCRVTVAVELESVSLAEEAVGENMPVGRGVRGTTVWVEVVEREDEDEEEGAGEGVRDGEGGEDVPTEGEGIGGGEGGRRD